jgi:hypothetical protein
MNLNSLEPSGHHREDGALGGSPLHWTLPKQQQMYGDLGAVCNPA